MLLGTIVKAKNFRVRRLVAPLRCAARPCNRGSPRGIRGGGLCVGTVFIRSEFPSSGG